MPGKRRLLRAMLTPPLLMAAFTVVLFEDAFWAFAVWLGGYIGRIPLFATFERLAGKLSPRQTFGIFAIPIALLVPFKITALWLMGSGHFWLGLCVLLVAKTVGTAISARLFTVARPKLMQVPTFALIYHVVTAFVARARTYMNDIPAWRALRDTMHDLKKTIHTMAAARTRRSPGRFSAAMRRFRKGY